MTGVVASCAISRLLLRRGGRDYLPGWKTKPKSKRRQQSPLPKEPGIAKPRRKQTRAIYPGRPTGWERSLGNIQNYSARQPTQIYAGAEMRPPPPDQARPTGGRDTTRAFQAQKMESWFEKSGIE